MNRFLTVPTMYLAVAFLATPSFAQIRTGTITGRIVEAQTREPIVGASALILGTTFGAPSDSLGRFIITAIPIGTYSVRISILGYQTVVKTDVVVSVGAPTEITVQMMEMALNFDEVTVSADYFQKNPETPISVQSLGYEEIRRLPGGLEDIARAIAILPGVAQAILGRNDLIVRGGAPSENLYVVDNIEVPNINHFATQGSGGGPLSFINLDFVDKTSFSTGGFGVRYGDKLSSVLTIDLKNGRRDRLGGKATISASQFGANLEGPIDESGSFIFSARRSFLDFIFRAAGLSFVPEYWDFLAKADYRLGARDELTFLGIGTIDRVKLLENTPQARYDNSRILYSGQDEAIGGLSWKHLFSGGYSTTTLSANRFAYNYRQDDTLLQPIFTNDAVELETALRSDIVLLIDRSTEFSFGALLKAVDFTDNLHLPTFYTNYRDSVQANARFDTLAWKGAAYVQASQTIGRHVRVTGGGRLEFFSLIRQKAVVSPRIAVRYEFTTATSVGASVGRYYEAPAYIWLVANPANRGLSFIGVNQYILGLEHLFRADIKSTIELYLKRYDHYPASLTERFLVLANTGAGFGGSQEAYASFGIDPLTSGGSGRAYGAELCVQKKLSELPFYGIISVSWNTTDFTALDNVSRPGAYDQRWIINLGGGYVLNEDWEFGAKFRFVSGRPWTPYNPDGTQNPDLYNSLRTGSNHSLDLRVDKRWNFTGWNLITYIDVQNVYNRKPVDVPVYDERTGTVEQNSSTIGILPSIGISAEF